LIQSKIGRSHKGPMYYWPSITTINSRCVLANNIVQEVLVLLDYNSTNGLFAIYPSKIV